MFILLYLKRYRTKILHEKICVLMKTAKTAFAHTKKYIWPCFLETFFVSAFHRVVVFLTFIKRTRTDSLSVFKQTNLSCLWALGLMLHRPDGHIGSLQTSCLQKLCVQLQGSKTAFSGS